MNALSRTVGRALVPVVLAAVGVVHLLPLAGVLGGERLLALYGVPADDPNLALLLRHRAVLFGLLGSALLAAAWRPAWRGPALAAAAVSVLSFLLLARLVGPLNAPLWRVFWIDVGAAVALAPAVVMQVLHRRGDRA